MTLPLSTRRNDYTGTSLVSAYSYTFKIFSDDDLLLVVADTNGVETVLTKTTDYTVAGVGGANGGTVTLVNAAQAWLTNGFLKTNYHLSVLGKRSVLQDTSIRNQGPYYPNVIEDTWDKIVVLLQQLQEKANRAITFQKTSTQTGIEIKATLAGNANKMLRANSTEDGLAFTSLTESDLTNIATQAQASQVSASNSANAAAASAASVLASAAQASLDAAAAAASAAAAAGSATGIGTPAQEVLVGTFAAGNTTYTLSQTPGSAATVLAILGAVPQRQVTDYTIVGKVITFTGTDTSGDTLLALYRY